MCGLAGLVDLRKAPTESAVRQSLDALGRRGPDSRVAWHREDCTLLHCRLRVLDVSERADQPLLGAGPAPVAMIYNGEIYNFRALRQELEAAGHRFHTSGDGEVLLAGYQAWGHGVFRRARGMWAVAFWHPDQRKLVLSRDPLGKKPLLYAADGTRIAFASGIPSLLPLLDGRPQPDVSALDCYLAHLAVPFEHTAFHGIDKVPPGSVVTWTPGAGVAVDRYWSVPAAPAPGNGDTEPLEALLRQAVRRRLESDVPLGVFLSAGLDSGLVAALAAEESGSSLVAVTAGTRGSGHDERAVARLLAERYGLEHRALEVPAASAAALPRLIAELGEPFGDASILPSFEVARAARREITVALTGDGGDEGFFGYDTFRGVRLAQAYRRFLPARLRRVVAGWLGKVTRPVALRRLGALAEYGAGPLTHSFRNRMGFGRVERQALLRSGRDNHEADHIYAGRLAARAGLPDADALRRTLFETFLPNDYLVKVDTATMAASLEARSPFLDIDLVEFVLALPAAVAFPGGRRKALLRPLAQRLLPREYLDRPKTGFAVPTGDWMREALAPAMDEFVFRPGTLLTDLLAVEAAQTLYDEHRHGADHATRLWALLALGVWCAVVVEGRWSSQDPLPLAAGAGR